MIAPLATPAARRARARILELSREGRADHDFLGELSSQLRKIVPFEGAFWAAADPLTMLATSPARVENVAEDRCVGFWECEFLAEDFVHFRDLARAARPAASLYRATAGRPARSIRYRLVNRPQGYGDELRGVFRTDQCAWGFVSLWRHDDHAGFDSADEKLLADLSEPLAHAFRRAALIGDGPLEDRVDAPGMLLFAKTGVLESLNEQAEAWLRELPQTVAHGDRSTRIPLPTEILTVSAQARAIAEGLEHGIARARIQTRAGRWLVIHGFRLRGADGEDGRIALVIEPARASQVAPVIVEAYQLTTREQQITQMISRGLSTAEIAARLHLSNHTVRDYIKKVFEKVGVSSRGELVAKIFAEHYAEPMRASIGHDESELTHW